jgi:hypothetical protein
MASRRMISSDIFEDDFVGSLSFFERLVWIGVFGAVADDQGRLLDSPVLIRSKVFLYDANVSDDKVDEALVKMAMAGKITRYQADGKRLLQITSWWIYQTPAWASPSKFPPPEGWMDRVKYHVSGNKIVVLNWDKPGGYPDKLPSGLHSGLGSGIEDGEGDGNGNGEVGSEGAGLTNCDDLQALGVLSGVTGMLEYPGTLEQKQTARDKIRACMTGRNVAQTVEYLMPFYLEWRERKYFKTNLAWLDWGIAGEIPPAQSGPPDGKGGSRRRATGAREKEQTPEEMELESARSYVRLNPHSPLAQKRREEYAAKGITL